MTINVMLGVGGTGAKIVESALYLFLSGLGPNKVIVGLVDQDKANGNVSRSCDLVTDLMQFRQDWGTGKNQLDWSKPETEGGAVLGRVEIEPLFPGAPGNPHWAPDPNGSTTLANVLGAARMSEGEKQLFDMLFTPGPIEQEMLLTQGYQGRAHVGAAAMLASLEQNTGEFCSRITELIEMARSGQEVRIFLAGSVFGGTGAAGFPTLARAINRIREQVLGANKSQVRICGSLMLPYFGFKDPADPFANVVKTKDLLPQARAALEYYDELLKTETVFDELYVTGWDENFQLGYHEPGKAEQKNPPLPPELLSALAAVEFLQNGVSSTDRPQTFVSARGDPSGVRWDDLPFKSDSARHDAYLRIGQLLRFAVYWLMRAEPALDQRGMLGQLKDPWKKLAADTDFKAETPEDRKALKDLLIKVLKWAAAMHLFGTRATPQGSKFGIWDTSPLERAINLNRPSDPVVLPESMEGAELAKAFDQLIAVEGRRERWRTAGDLFEDLHKPTASDTKNKGFGRVVAAVHAAARATLPQQVQA
jgi:hypothetical protein